MKRQGALRAVTYHRVSTIDQNPTNARRALAAFAKMRGFVVVEAIEETGSGAKASRPGYQRVLELARTREVDVVIVWKCDRFGRSLVEFLSAIERMKGWGVRFMSSTEGFVDVGPGSDAAGELVLGVLAVASQFERRQIAERTRLALARVRAEGKHIGRPVDDAAPDGARVAGMRGQGMSWRDVATAIGCTVDAARRAVKRLEREGLS